MRILGEVCQITIHTTYTCEFLLHVVIRFYV